jgi:hypothetical protein
MWISSTRSEVQPSPAPKKDVSSRSREPLDATGPASSKLDEAAPGTELEVSNIGTAGMYSVADFVPVPFADRMGPEDPGMVVRVQMTRASLAELGYPVDEVYSSDLVRADVLVGQDGWPRGVRVVQ